MTKEEFKTQSNALFFQTKEGMCKKIVDDSKLIFENASQQTTAAEASAYMQQHLSKLMSMIAFEASCSYSEKLVLLLFDHLSK